MTRNGHIELSGRYVPEVRDRIVSAWFQLNEDERYSIMARSTIDISQAMSIFPGFHLFGGQFVPPPAPPGVRYVTPETAVVGTLSYMMARPVVIHAANERDWRSYRNELEEIATEIADTTRPIPGAYVRVDPNAIKTFANWRAIRTSRYGGENWVQTRRGDVAGIRLIGPFYLRGQSALAKWYGAFAGFRARESRTYERLVFDAQATWRLE